MANCYKLLILIFFFTFCKSKVFTPCEVAKELISRGFDKSKINDWVCLIESESTYNSKAINKHNTDGSWDYGLFQLNSKYWCQGQKTIANSCNIECTALLTDSLDPSAECAKTVFKVHGFDAWYGWKKKCENKDISFYTKDCSL